MLLIHPIISEIMKPILIYWNIICNHSAITKLTTNINKSHWGDVDLAIIVSPGSSTIELPYSIVPTDKWSARVSLKYADEIFLEDVLRFCWPYFNLHHKCLHESPKHTEQRFWQVLNVFCMLCHLWLTMRPVNSINSWGLTDTRTEKLRYYLL